MNDRMAIALREFQAAARGELEVRGIESSWILSRIRPAPESVSQD
jgi:hypothetical protein